MKKSELLEEYKPYTNFRAFHDGWNAYEGGHWFCPYSANSTEGQAWDRGMEAAMRWHRRTR